MIVGTKDIDLHVLQQPPRRNTDQQAVQNSQHAADAAERLRLALDTGEVRFEKGLIQDFTASFGVVTLSSNANAHDKVASIDDLLIRADYAMYQAKKNGRNQVCFEQTD